MKNNLNNYGRNQGSTYPASRCSTMLTVLALLFLAAACSRSSKPASPSTDAATQPAAAETAQPMPAETAEPTPAFSAAQKIGMFVYPKNNQSNDQQLRDEFDCYNQVEQQTGINPESPAPTGPSSAEIQAAQQQAAEQAPQQRGGRARGAARGAAGGAVIGGIAGDAGKGAAAGAAFGTMRGGRQQRQSNAAAKEQAAQSAEAQVQQQGQQAKAAYNQQLSTFKRGFSACMDARGYSVK